MGFRLRMHTPHRDVLVRIRPPHPPNSHQQPPFPPPVIHRTKFAANEVTAAKMLSSSPHPSSSTGLGWPPSSSSSISPAPTPFAPPRSARPTTNRDNNSNDIDSNVDIYDSVYDPSTDPGPWQAASLYGGPSTGPPTNREVPTPKNSKLCPAKFVLKKDGSSLDSDDTIPVLTAFTQQLYHERLHSLDPDDKLSPRAWQQKHALLFERTIRQLTLRFPVLESRRSWKARRLLSWHIDKRKAAKRSAARRKKRLVSTDGDEGDTGEWNAKWPRRAPE